MNYANIITCDIANGEGIRTSLFVSGCNNHCKGCFNRETWDFDYGKPFTQDTVDFLIENCTPYYIQGLSILGGEPLDKANINTVTDLCRQFKNKLSNKDIWLYTGYLFDDYKDCEIMKYVDIVVDGRFIEEQADITLKFRGSRNQRIINVRDFT